MECRAQSPYYSRLTVNAPTGKQSGINQIHSYNFTGRAEGRFDKPEETVKTRLAVRKAEARQFPLCYR